MAGRFLAVRIVQAHRMTLSSPWAFRRRFPSPLEKKKKKEKKNKKKGLSAPSEETILCSLGPPVETKSFLVSTRLQALRRSTDGDLYDFKESQHPLAFTYIRNPRGHTKPFQRVLRLGWG